VSFDNSKATLVVPAVCKVLSKWKCSGQVKAELLGFSGEEELDKVMSNPDAHVFSNEEAERMSHILNIYRSLHTLFSKPNQADEWVNKTNKDNIFNGQSALGLMKRGTLSDLALVSNYLSRFTNL
jgi:hypothetical protein